MLFHFRRTPGLVVLMAWVVSGCAFQQMELNQIQADYQRLGPGRSLSAYENRSPSSRDRPQYLLNLGTLQLLQGNHAQSITTLQQAKIALEQSQAISVTENMTALTLNETLRSFGGSSTEQVMIQGVQILNYLLGGNLHGARVEVLQADTLMNRLESEDQRGQLASVRFLGGLVFELNNEPENALIDYRKALQLIDKRNRSVPKALQIGLLRMTLSVGLMDEHQRFLQRFSDVEFRRRAGAGELILFYWQGVAPLKRQGFISVYSPELQHNLSLAMPYYEESRGSPTGLRMVAADQSLQTQVLEDFDPLLRDDLEALKAKLLATNLARMVAKHQAVRQGNKENNALGALLNLASILTEAADTRSWNLLPRSLQVARLVVPVNTAEGVSVELAPRPGPVVASKTEVSHRQPSSAAINLKAGDVRVALVQTYDDRVLSHAWSSAEGRLSARRAAPANAAVPASRQTRSINAPSLLMR